MELDLTSLTTRTVVEMKTQCRVRQLKLGQNPRKVDYKRPHKAWEETRHA